MKKHLIVICLAVAALLAGCGLSQSASSSSAGSSVREGYQVGDRAPSITVKDAAGKTVTIQPAKDQKIYVLNFWATWCPPCRAELPELQKFAREKDQDVTFYAINLQESPEKVQGFLQDMGVQVPVLLDQKGSTTRPYYLKYIPTTVIVDKQGIIRFRKSGGVTNQELKQILDGLKESK